MAKLIQAFSAFGPRIDLMGAADPQRTTLSAGTFILTSL
jgi:hypothetical protein